MEPAESAESLEEQARRIARRFAEHMAKHPESDPHTVLRILQDLEMTPEERVRRSLSLGRYSLFRRAEELSGRTPET